MVLPHELVHALHQDGWLDRACGADALREFWAHFRASSSEDVAWPTNAPSGHAHPLGIHGDDCRFTES